MHDNGPMCNMYAPVSLGYIQFVFTHVLAVSRIKRTQCLWCDTLAKVSENSSSLYRLYKQVTDLAYTRGIEGTSKSIDTADNRGIECPTL